MKMFLSLLILVAFLAIALSDEVIASMTSPVIKTDASAQKVETVRTKKEELALLKFDAKPSSYYNKAANRDNEKTKYVSKRNLGGVSTKEKYGSGSGYNSSFSNESKKSKYSGKSGKSGKYSDKSGKSKKSKYSDKSGKSSKSGRNPVQRPVQPPPPPPPPPVQAPAASNCNPTNAPVCTPTCNDK